MTSFNSRDEKKIGQSIQLNLWEKVTVDPVPSMKAAMNQAIKDSSLSREQIVDEMNRLAAIAGITCGGRSQKTTLTVLEKWVAPGATAHIIPIRILPLFCRAVSSNLPLQVYAQVFAGAKVISAKDEKILKWAKSELTSRLARKKAKQLAQDIGL